MVKVCAFASCRSTSRKDTEMAEMGFARFVPPEFDLERAALWVRKLCRPEFGIRNITRFTYVKVKYFPMYHGVQVNTVKIDLERKLTFFWKCRKGDISRLN